MRQSWSVAVFARWQGRVLLILHRRLGTWLPVGGEVEVGESPLQAATRELLEETGLQGRAAVVPDGYGRVEGTPEGLIGYEEHPAGSKGLHLNLSFVMDVDSDQVKPNAEFGEFRWVDGVDGVVCPPNVTQLLQRALCAPWTPMEALGRRWMAAFNARDLEGVLRLYTEDAVHHSPKLKLLQPQTQGRVSGKEALRLWFADAMNRLPGLRYEPLRFTASGSQVVMEYTRHNPGEASYPVAEILSTAPDGRICASQVFHA